MLFKSLTGILNEKIRNLTNEIHFRRMFEVDFELRLRDGYTQNMLFAVVKLVIHK